MNLRLLAMICVHFERDQICTQVDASFSSFGHPTQVNASVVKPINLLSAYKIQDFSTLKRVFGIFEYLRENLRVRLATQRNYLQKLLIIDRDRSIVVFCRFYFYRMISAFAEQI